MELGLRHQGVLLSAVRGCDTAPKDDPSKRMSRVFRAAILRSHCGDPLKSLSFIEEVTDKEFNLRAEALLYSLDQYPFHFIMHFVHAAEICGYYHPEEKRRQQWLMFYLDAVNKMHMHPETKEELDKRLNADEATFHLQQLSFAEREKEEKRRIEQAEKALKYEKEVRTVWAGT